MDAPGPESKEDVIERLTQQIRRWKLSVPALLLLEVARPFSFIASQGLLLCQPLLSYIIEEPIIVDYAELLADRKNVDHLVARLEQSVPVRGRQGKEEI
ncbi:MAG: hypothetical protein PVJ34_14990 [Anaerolineae bacterium]|jgi:hypothetical protein